MNIWVKTSIELLNTKIVCYTYFSLSLILLFLIIYLSFYLTITEINSNKLKPYECGFTPYTSARNTVNVHFYLISLLFLIFDIETIFFLPVIFMYPWLTTLGSFVLIEFIWDLLLGYIYLYNTDIFHSFWRSN